MLFVVKMAFCAKQGSIIPMVNNPEIEIEITPEMLSAGIEAACLYNPIHDEFDIILPAIFRAMLLASPRELLPR